MVFFLKRRLIRMSATEKLGIRFGPCISRGFWKPSLDKTGKWTTLSCNDEFTLLRSCNSVSVSEFKLNMQLCQVFVE